MLTLFINYNMPQSLYLCLISYCVIAPFHCLCGLCSSFPSTLCLKLETDGQEGNTEHSFSTSANKKE